MCTMESVNRFSPVFQKMALSRALPTVTALAPRLRGAVGTGSLSAVRLPLPGGQTPPPRPGLTLVWSFAMSGLRSERLKSWKEEKEAIVRGAHAALSLLGILPTPANTGSHPTRTRTTRSSATGSQDEEGTGRSTDTRPVPSVSGCPEPHADERGSDRSGVPCTTPQGHLPTLTGTWWCC